MVAPYPAGIEAQMQRYYQSLLEKDRRRYAGIEAAKLGYGGIKYISRLLECDYGAIKYGMRELDDAAALSQRGMRQGEVASQRLKR